MQRRDYIVINKILSEIEIAFDMIGVIIDNHS